MVWAMLSRLLIGLVGAVGATAIGVPGVAGAEPPPPPPPPNIGGFALVKPSEFTVAEGTMYAFTVGGGITCVMSRTTGGYGCNGPLPAAPEGANVVSGGQVGPPGFTTTAAPIFSGPANPLPPNSRIAFRNISCGTDGVMTSCQNSFDQSGFVISPGGSFILNEVNPLVERPEGTNPFFN